MQHALRVDPQPLIENETVLVNTVGEICDAANYLNVASREELGTATDLVKLIKTRHREIDAERDGLVRPLNGTVDKINARFKTILAPLKAAEEGIKAKMLAFQQEEARQAAEARRVAEEAAKKAEEEAERLAEESDRASLPTQPLAVPEPLPVPRTTYGAYGGVSTLKKSWTFELLDIAALAAARPDLIVVDTAKVNAEIKGRGGDIPGLRVYEKEIISIR
jgi:hypothetical protein